MNVACISNLSTLNAEDVNVFTLRKTSNEAALFVVTKQSIAETLLVDENEQKAFLLHSYM